MVIPPDIFVHQLDSDASIARNWADLLSREEIDRRAGMRSESRRNQFVLGRLAVRQLLGRLLDRRPEDVTLNVQSSGQVVAPDSGFKISIAHSQNRAVAIASKRTIGVDLEYISEKPETLLNYIMNEQESGAVKRLPLSVSEQLFLTWTLKEAVLKAKGTGLRISPRKLTVCVDLEENRATIKDSEEQIWLATFSITPPYVLVIAYQ